MPSNYFTKSEINILLRAMLGGGKFSYRDPEHDYWQSAHSLSFAQQIDCYKIEDITTIKDLHLQAQVDHILNKYDIVHFKTKEEIICNKVKQMYARRKERGYAF
jgi:hypothetical protein